MTRAVDLITEVTRAWRLYCLSKTIRMLSTEHSKKTIGNGTLKWEEPQEVVIHVKTTLNNRPLSYVKDDIELPVLTPYSMMFLNKNNIPEMDL